MTLQAAGAYCIRVATDTRGLLPRVFTLAVRLRQAAVVFCYVVPELSPGCAFRSAVALSCPDFPPREGR